MLDELIFTALDTEYLKVSAIRKMKFYAGVDSAEVLNEMCH